MRANEARRESGAALAARAGANTASARDNAPPTAKYTVLWEPNTGSDDDFSHSLGKKRRAAGQNRFTV